VLVRIARQKLRNKIVVREEGSSGYKSYSKSKPIEIEI